MATHVQEMENDMQEMHDSFSSLSVLTPLKDGLEGVRNSLMTLESEVTGIDSHLNPQIVENVENLIKFAYNIEGKLSNDSEKCMVNILLIKCASVNLHGYLSLLKFHAFICSLLPANSRATWIVDVMNNSVATSLLLKQCMYTPFHDQPTYQSVSL